MVSCSDVLITEEHGYPRHVALMKRKRKYKGRDDLKRKNTVNNMKGNVDVLLVSSIK